MTQATPLTLDVRPELRAGDEPFPRIMQGQSYTCHAHPPGVDSGGEA